MEIASLFPTFHRSPSLLCLGSLANSMVLGCGHLSVWLLLAVRELGIPLTFWERRRKRVEPAERLFPDQSLHQQPASKQLVCSEIHLITLSATFL